MQSNSNSPLIAISDQREWSDTLKQFDHSDFYHTYDYHRFSKKEDESAILLYYHSNDFKVAIPLLIRPIEGTKIKDATSVYGYPGPLTSGNLSPANCKAFQNHLLEFFNNMGIISVFSRLNPYIPSQPEVLSGIGQIETTGSVVNIDLTKDLATQRASYSKSTKSRVNKARRLSYVKEVTSVEDINIFIDIYHENMRRLEASDAYFFSREYFFDFYRSPAIDTRILMVYHSETNEPMAGSMFVCAKSIVQFHLSGTRDKFLEIAPARVFIDEMRILATEEGNYKFFNLGGGLGGKEDSLFTFKSSFSKDFRDFNTWKFIVNKEVYQQLVSEKTGSSDLETSEFFPLYRQP